MRNWRNLELSRDKFFRLSATGAVLIGLVLSLTFGANINLNTQNKIEFGQGILQAVACDTQIVVNLSSQLNTSTGVYNVSSLILSDLSTQLHDRTITVNLVGSDGRALNAPLSFAVASDGLTYTSTRAHVDNLNAFTAGSGPKAEMGASQITFTSLLTEEPTPIPADSVKSVALQTEGSGTCSVPSNIPAVKLYIDAPYVQGSYIPELYPSASLVDTFDSAGVDLGDCSSLSNQTGAYSGDCKIILKTHANPYPYGGAITTSSTPTTGNQTNQSPSAAVYTATGLTVTFSSNKNYIGFWWSAGSTGNAVKFYRGTKLVATMTGDDVYSTIHHTSATLTALNGTTLYTQSDYYGHPANTASWDSGEPFVYFHAFAVNGFNFDKVVLNTTGNGFEYDNFTVANLGGSQLTAKDTLVFIASYNYSG